MLNIYNFFLISDKTSFERPRLLYTRIPKIQLLFKTLSSEKCLWSKALIGHLRFQRYFSSYSRDISNKFIPPIYKPIGLYNVQSYKSFFLLRNLRKANRKFKYLQIISLNFIFYSSIFLFKSLFYFLKSFG